MRIGLLGSGAMGKRHLAAAAALPGVELVPRTSPPFDRIDSADREALLCAMLADASLDAIDICLPTPRHVAVALAALAAGKHVLCEKPMALTPEDCAQLLATAQASGRVLMVAHVLRFFPAYRRLAQAVRAAELGPVVRARFTRMSGIPGWGAWLTQQEESGGAVLDLLVHDFDQAIALFGAPAHIRAKQIESADTVRCVLSYAGGLEVEIEGGWFADGRPFAMGFDVECARGRLVFREERLTLCRANGTTEELPLPETDPYREQLRYFWECCTNGSAPVECPPEASAAAVALAVAVRGLAERAPGAAAAYPLR